MTPVSRDKGGPGSDLLPRAGAAATSSSSLACEVLAANSVSADLSCYVVYLVEARYRTSSSSFVAAVRMWCTLSARTDNSLAGCTRATRAKSLLHVIHLPS